MNVLVVDDDQDIRRLIETFLTEMGISPVTAESAQSAYEKIEQQKPDLMFLDIRLPDGNGLDVLKKIKGEHPQIPVVMLTGFKEAELVVEAFRHGALDCLLKPINFEYLKLNILSRFQK